MTSLAEACQELLAALNRTEIPFLIGGAVASGIYGLPRLTNDIDFVIDLNMDRVPDFCDAFGSEWCADREMIASAARAGRSFNVVHLASAFKFDFFPAGGNSFSRSQLARRRYTTTILTGLENIEFPVASAEDTLLSKLVWYRQRKGLSDQQWHDILAVVHVQAGRLDREYLKKWAQELGVSELLAKALE